MLYKSLEDVRCRSNKIALKLNEATHYGRRPLPPEFADLAREWDELADIKPADFVKGGVEVVETTTADDAIEGDPKFWISEMARRNKK